MASNVVVGTGGRSPRKPRGEYRIGPRLRKCFELMVTGIGVSKAAEQASISERAVYASLKRPKARAELRGLIGALLNLSAAAAARRMHELLFSENQQASFNAARFCLAVGADVSMPDRPSTSIAVNVDVKPGFVLDLREYEPVPAPSGLVIDAEAPPAPGAGEE